MTVAILITGGTFDKEYNELNGELYFQRSHVREMLALGRARVAVRLQTLMMKDSLVLTGAEGGFCEGRGAEGDGREGGGGEGRGGEGDGCEEGCGACEEGRGEEGRGAAGQRE